MKTSKFTPEQLPPTCQDAINALAQLIDCAAYPDIDATTHEGAVMLLARWRVGAAALEKLADGTGCTVPEKGE